MRFQLSRLVQVQQLDLKLDDLERQRQRIPQRLHAVQLPVDQARHRLDDIQASLETMTAERRSGEQDLSEHESRINKLRERLGELKTNKEYQAHLFEIELANKKKDALEEKILLAMEQSEEKRKELEEVRTLVQDLTQALEQEKAELESLAERLTREATQTGQEKTDLSGSVDKQVYHRYTRLKSSLQLPVVVLVPGGTCQGCQLQIPPQLIASVKRADQLLACPYCDRILYDETILDTAHEYASAEEPVAQEGGNR